ncbi:interleukin-15-like [Chanodichthys erythropterus]|uniref:interleukin-15-like n=1 Tax=Chanodichthys erythropterus TaxID=933992 RepID=UPI00351EA5E6
MPSLHWICALTLVLVCSLSAQPVKRSIAGRQLLKGALKNFKISKTKCPETRLYSPTDIHEDCLSSALNCTIDELQVLEVECDVTQDQQFTIIKNGLIRQKWNITSNSTRDCRCELYKETDVEQFVNNMKSLVERLNARP